MIEKTFGTILPNVQKKPSVWMDRSTAVAKGLKDI